MATTVLQHAGAATATERVDAFSRFAEVLKKTRARQTTNAHPTANGPPPTRQSGHCPAAAAAFASKPSLSAMPASKANTDRMSRIASARDYRVRKPKRVVNHVLMQSLRDAEELHPRTARRRLPPR